jgi:hypothetical protein
MGAPTCGFVRARLANVPRASEDARLHDLEGHEVLPGLQSKQCRSSCCRPPAHAHMCGPVVMGTFPFGFPFILFSRWPWPAVPSRKGPSLSPSPAFRLGGSRLCRKGEPRVPLRVRMGHGPPLSPFWPIPLARCALHILSKKHVCVCVCVCVCVHVCGRAHARLHAHVCMRGCVLE